jgi:hypothetical protein
VTAIVYDCKFDELLNKFKNNQIGSQFLQTNKLLPFVLREVAHRGDAKTKDKAARKRKALSRAAKRVVGWEKEEERSKYQRGYWYRGHSSWIAANVSIQQKNGRLS